MQSAAELNEAFGLPEVLVFDEPLVGMPRLRFEAPACKAELFLQGAHLTQWAPADRIAALFLSSKSSFAPGTAIRGGIPVIFPWFGAPSTSPVRTSPGAGQHGFARNAPWTLRFAALAGEDLHLSLTLDQTEAVRSSGFSGFELALDAVLGRTLTVRLTVANTGNAPLFFEEALHAYLAVGSSRAVSVDGLKNTEYLDKTDGFKRKQQTDTTLHFEGEVDRPYLNTVAPLTLHDRILGRRMSLTKTGSNSTVTWNPGPKLAAKLPDLADTGWQHFVCLETANVAENAITLPPGQAHSMAMQLGVVRT